jgi:hypothetical protein
MNMRKLTLAVIGLAAFLLTSGCDKGERATTPPGSTKVNAAFLQHFGEPPAPEQGTCFARVGYFPLASDPTKVRAIPLFLFQESEQLPRLLNRLVDRVWDFPPHSGLINPFPEGSEIRVAARTGESVSIDLLLPRAAREAEDFRGMIASVVETALQFEDITRVIITLSGEPLAEMPAGGFRHDPGRIVPVGPPLPLMVAGSWEEEDEAPPAEIHINFDRPVIIHELKLLDAAGREIPGEYFHSAFDMAVVVRPAGTWTLREGAPVRVSWQVSDHLGRRARGDQAFALEHPEHLDELPEPGEANSVFSPHPLDINN